MKKLSPEKKLLALSLLGGSLVTGAASAATCVTGSSSETSLQGVLDAITVGGPSSVDTMTDCLADSSDSNWTGGAGGSTTTLVIELAGNANTNSFGVYDTTNSSSKVQLFSGASTAGALVAMVILDDGSVLTSNGHSGVQFAGNSFGFFLATANNGTFYSDTSLHADMVDHMLAYRGTMDTIQLPGQSPGPWLTSNYALAWEDVKTSNGADFDFNDFVVMVNSVQPESVPVPAAVWLFGSGLLGLVGIARRKKTA